MATLLFLVHRLPYPLHKGDKVRSYHLLRHLQQQHRVFLGTFIDDPADEQHLPEMQALCPDLFVARIDARTARLRSLGSLFRREPMTLGYYRDRSMSAWVASVMAQHHIDKTVVFSSAMAQYAPTGVPMLVDFVDLDSAKWAQFAPAHSWPMSWVYERESRVLLDYERQVAAAAEHAFFVTPHELALFDSHAPECRGRAKVLRNGVDASYFQPLDGRASPYAAQEVPVIFTGAMDYWPNVDAVTWFAQDMLPRLRQRWPTLRFYIVGRSPVRQVQALASDGVVVTGTVDDVRPYLQHARAVVAPLRVARGIQNKILEAMAMAQAVVTTPSCADAVGATEAQGLLRASDAEGFVKELDLVLQRGSAQARQLGQAARQFVLSHCRWDTQLQPLDRYLGLSLPEGVAQC